LREFVSDDKEESRFDHVLEKTSLIQEKLVEKEIEKRSCINNLTVNQSRIDILLSIVNYITELNEDTQDYNEVLVVLMNSIDLLESKNVILKHNQDSSERAINNYKTQLNNYANSFKSPILQLRMSYNISLLNTQTYRMILECDLTFLHSVQKKANDLILMNMITKLKEKDLTASRNFFKSFLIPFMDGTVVDSEDDFVVCDSETDYNSSSFYESDLEVLSNDQDSVTNLELDHQMTILDQSMELPINKSETTFGQTLATLENSPNEFLKDTPKQPRLKVLNELALEDNDLTPRQSTKRKLKDSPAAKSIRKARRRHIRQSMIPIMHSKLSEENGSVVTNDNNKVDNSFPTRMSIGINDKKLPMSARLRKRHD
jgi:hypothetical protein